MGSRTWTLAIGSVLIVLIIGIAIPKLTVHDSVALTDAEKNCAYGIFTHIAQTSVLDRVALSLGKGAIIEKRSPTDFEGRAYTIFRMPIGMLHGQSDASYGIDCLFAAPPAVIDGTTSQGLGQFYDSPVVDGHKSYASDQLGVSFTYPGNYFLFTASSTDPHGAQQYGIALIPDSPDLQRAMAGTHNEPGMIPRIGFFFSRDPDPAASPDAWIRDQMTYRAGVGNFETPALRSVTVDGISAVRYLDTSGLYQRDTVLLRYDGRIVQITADDAVYFKTDFDSMLASIQLK